MRPKFHQLTVEDVRWETPDCLSVAFQVPESLREEYRFRAGQYLTLRAVIGGEDLRRSYSICSGLDDGELRVAIKRVDRGVFSSWAVEHLRPGTALEVMTPTGHFTVDPQPSACRRFLLIAAGSGITPVMGIARTVLRREPQSEVTLLYGNRYFRGIIFREELEDMKDRYLGRFRVFHVLSGEPNEVDLLHGRIDEEKLGGFCSTFIDLSDTDEAYICGPEPMIRAAREFLRGQGMAEDRIHVELFATPAASPEALRPAEKPKARALADTCRVTLIMDGQQSQFEMPGSGVAVLDAAREHGLDIPFSCKGGMCCTCRAHLDEGEVAMRLNYALEPGEVESGFILTCQAEPRSGSIVVNFDRQ